MEIYTSNTLGIAIGPFNDSGNKGSDEFSVSPLAPNNSDRNVSSLGKMINIMSGLSANDRGQAQAFREEMRSAIRGGDFDPEVMAQKAPDFMKQRAEQNGVSLPDVFQQIENRVDNSRHLNPYSLSSVQGGGQVRNDQLLESLLRPLTGGEEER